MPKTKKENLIKKEGILKKEGTSNCEGVTTVSTILVYRFEQIIDIVGRKAIHCDKGISIIDPHYADLNRETNMYYFMSTFMPPDQGDNKYTANLLGTTMFIPWAQVYMQLQLPKCKLVTEYLQHLTCLVNGIA